MKEPTPSHSNAPGGRRRGVEIYFVLYLTSLLLLLLDPRGTEVKPDKDLVLELLETNFEIQAEKNLLNCTVLNTEDGPRIHLLDSSNTIFSKGHVSDIQYEFNIVDVEGNKLFPVGAKQNNTGDVGFGYERIDEGKRARFTWRPDLNSGERAVYTIKVLASAKPLIPKRITSEEHRRQLQKIIDQSVNRVEDDTQFELSVSFIGNATLAAETQTPNPVDTVTRIVIQGGESPITIINAPAADITMAPQQTAVNAVANARWNNRVVVGGINMNSDVDGTPSVSVDGDGSAAIKTIDNGAINIDGTAPSQGEMTVTLQLKRRSDGQISRISFVVRARPLPAALVPDQMYPGLAYDFDPRFPALLGQEIKAILRDKTGRERHVSMQGERFSFTPTRADIGGEFELIRSVNGRVVASGDPIVVRDFPIPEVAEINTQSKLAIIRTRAYGGPQSSNRIKIELSGNAAIIRERHGEWEYLPEGNMHIQVFEVQPRYDDRHFEFEVIAVDRKGRKSIPESVGK